MTLILNHFLFHMYDTYNIFLFISRKQSRSGRDLESGNLEEECDEDYSEDRARTDRRESRIHGMAMESGDSIDDISDEDTTTLKKKNNVEADKEMSERDVLFGMLKGYSVTR